MPKPTAVLVVLTLIMLSLYIADSRVREFGDELDRVAAAGAVILGDLENHRAEIDKTLKAMRGSGGKSYLELIGKHNTRMEDYLQMETSVNSIKTTFQSVNKLKRRLGYLVGLQRSLDMTFKACVDSVFFSKGAGEDYSCHGNALYVVVKDINTNLKQYSSNAEKLRDTGWLERLRAKRLRERERKPASEDRPNIIILLIDTLRANDMGAYNPASRITPVIDRLAGEGALYEQALSPSASTYISVSSIFAGADPYETDSLNEHMWNYPSSLVPAFQNAGYNTIAFSANGLVCPHLHFDAGFDFFMLRFGANFKVLLNELLSYLRYEHEGRKPFFMYLHFLDPHDPYFSPDKVKEVSVRGRPEGIVADPRVVHREYVEKGLNPLRHLPQGNAEYLHEIYRDEVEYTDRNIGILLGEMKKIGLLENTLLVVTSDHGEQFLEHGDVLHTTQVYQELVHVPLILWGQLPQGLKPGTRIASPHSTMELLPSLLDSQGIAVSGNAGKRVTLFSAEQPAEPVMAVARGWSFDMANGNHELIALFDGKDKLILDVDTGEHRLFDLAKDRKERKDLATVLPEVAKRLKNRALAQKNISLNANKELPAKSPSKEIRNRLKELGYIK